MTNKHLSLLATLTPAEQEWFTAVQAAIPGVWMLTDCNRHIHPGKVNLQLVMTMPSGYQRPVAVPFMPFKSPAEVQEWIDKNELSDARKNRWHEAQEKRSR